jgi:hypothetical protein
MRALIATYARQIACHLPDARLRSVLDCALAGIVTHCSPLIARMASISTTESNEPEAAAKQFYRFFANDRVTPRALWQGIHDHTRCLVAAAKLRLICVVIDSVNLEKPYARKMPGLSTIRKHTAANRRHDQELTRGFPALACVALVTGLPALTFARLFSYTTLAFVSVKREVLRAILTTRLVLQGYIVRFIGDREFDDDETMLCMARHGNQFLVRAYHHRTIEVWDAAQGNWHVSSLQEYADTLSLPARFTAEFTHSRRKRLASVRLGYGRIRLPKPYNLECRLIVGHADIFKKPLWLLTNAPIPTLEVAVSLWWEFRNRPDIEDLFRLLQERGFDIEDMRLRSLVRLEKLVAVVWAAAQFLWHLSLTLPQDVQRWLRRLGGKTHKDRGSNGLYLLLYGLAALLLEYFLDRLRQGHAKAPPGGISC